MELLQVYGMVRRVGRVPERAADREIKRERERVIDNGREGETCNATYGIGNCWVATLGSEKRFVCL